MNPFFLTGLKTSLLFEQNGNNKCCEIQYGLCRYRPVPKSLWCNINIARPDYSAVLDRGLEEEWRVDEFGKGFFSKTSSSVKSLRVETAMTSRSSSIISSPHLYHPKLSWWDIKIPYTDFFFNILSLKVLKFARKAKV